MNSVTQKHVIHNSPNEVNSIIEENKVYFQSINPDQIKLNDGRENLERIMNYKTNMENVKSHTVKHIPTNRIIHSETDKINSGSYKHNDLKSKQNKDKSSSKTSSELANEKLMEMNLLDENLTDEDFSIETISMEYPFEKTSP